MSIMDINDIINMQSDAATESTLESEIDALSKIITDTKDGSQKLDDTDEDFKLDSDDLSFTANLQYDSAESDKCELLTDDGLGIKDILDGSAEIDSFMSATSQSSQSIQDVSKETSETIDDSEKNKDSNNKTEDLTTLPETTNQNEIETTSHKDPLNANNSLSLINEVYGVEEPQNSTETESVSVPEITENIKPLSTSQDTVKSQSENSNILEDVTDNKETISISSDSTNEISKIGDSTIKNSAQETVDSGIIKEPSIQNSNEKNIETINDDINESSISEIVNLVEKEDTVKESLPLEEIEEKEKTNTNEPTAETLVEETPMEVDDLDDENNKNTESPNISKIDIVQEIIDQPNDDTETATNVDKIQAEKEKSENDIEENKIEDTKTTINEMESELVEPSVPISEIKVSLDNESSTNSFQSCLQTIDESKTSKNNENLETLGESTMIVKETLEDCNVEVKIESIATENTKSNISQVQELEKIDESEPMDVDEPINDDSEITKNTEEENITTLKVTEENINIKNIENTEVTDEEKSVPILQDANDSKKDETSNDVKEKIDNTKEEKMEVDTITEDLESQKIDENIKTLENESINSTVESSHEKVIDKVDSIHEVETITETEQSDCTNLENINANVDTETLQETKPDCNIKLLINTESEENKIKNIETTTTVQEVISPIMESKEILENLEESDTNADNITIIQDEKKISDIKPLEDVTSLEKLNTNIIDVAASQETKTLNDTEPVEIKEHLENPNINKDDTTVSKELITTSNNESTEISEKLASSVTDTKDEMNLQEIETISNIESVQNIKDSESTSEKTKIVETVEEIKESSNLEFSENMECSKNSNVSEKTIEELEEIKTVSNIELSEIIENSETSNTNVDNDILQEIKITTNDETVDDKMVIDNEIPQDIQEHTNSESIKNSDANDLQDIKSLQDPLNIENKNTTIAEENIESEVNISDKESDLINKEETIADKESDLINKEETIADNEILLCNIKDDTEKKEICEDKENKEIVKTTDNLVTIPEQYNDTISSEDACEVIDKNIPKSENVDDHNMEPLQTNDVKENDEKLSKDSLKNVCKELNDENLISHRVETPEDLNITLELEEPETLDKVHLTENADLKEVVDEPKFIEKMEDDVFEEKEAFMEVNVQEELIEKQETQDIHEEESEDQVEINLSIDPDGYSSPIVHNLLEDQTALKDPLADLIENENAEVPDSLVTEESDLNEILNVNQKVDEIFSSDPDSNTQGLASEILNDSENELGSDLNELLKTDENIKEVGDLDNSEILNIPSKDPPLLDEKSQDSLSILDTLQTEPMSVEEEKIESKEFESAEKEEDITLMLEESSQSPRQLQNDKFIRDLYNKCVSNNVVESKETELEDIIECNEPVSVDKENIDVDVEKQVEVNENLEDPKISLEIEGSAQLNETETLEVDTKLPVSNIENEVHLNEPTAEMSEVESAVKFLQESEERDIQNSKMIEDMTVDANSSIFVSVEDSECDNASELISDMPEMTLDPIAISEAEIISEAVKLESERKEKLELEQQLKSSVVELIDTDSMGAIETSALPTSDNLLSIIEPNEQLNILPAVSSKDIIETPLITERKLTSGTLPMASVLDDRYKEPPKIEIPEISPKLCDLPTTPKASLLIQRDAKLRQDSPDPQFGSEPKITDTPKKDISDKQQQQQQQQQQPPQYLECENVGSPRIILKIAKSAIADCSEPRSPKSPKIRSAANSPNPEDSPGQKLGKIKLKLSKGGHPSIIPSGDSHDESVGQWHTDSSTSSLSPLGVKIKLTKSSETSVTESKHEDAEDSRKNEASIGMKIKLSKTGDASIVQQDNSPKEASNQKHKDTKEITQEAVALKKPDSPSIGMKIKLSKSGDASIIQQDNKAQVVEEHKETVSKAKDKTVDDVQEETRRTESPIGMKIKFSKSGDASVIANEPSEPSKEAMDIKERNEDSIKRTDSPIGVKIKLAKTKGGSASIITSETTEETKEKIDNVEGSKKGKVSKKREAPEDTSEASTKDLEQSKAKIAKLSGEGDASISDVSDESAKTGIGMKIKLSKSGDASVVHTKRDDSPSDIARKASEQPIGMKIKLSKTGDPSIIHSEVFKEAEDVAHSPKAKHSKNKDHGMSQQKAKDDSHLEMKIKLSKTGHPTIITTNELQEDSIKISNVSTVPPHKYKEHKDLLTFKESTLKALKKSHSDVTIEPIKTQSIENTMIDLHNKRKEITIAPIEAKKSKMEANLKQMLPDVTIQPIMSIKKEQQQQQQQQQQKLLLESKSGSISRQQMNVINQEISITQICSLATGDTLMGERLKNALNVPNEAKGSSPLHSDCEIIEPQPELIIVNENSNSSQDVMIIDEVPPAKSTAKVPKKRGRPRRNAAAAAIPNIAVPVANFPAVELQRDPLSLDQSSVSIMQQQKMQAPPIAQQQQQHQQQAAMALQQPQIAPPSAEGSERPRRTCRSQKSYAPPKRGRGRGRGKRKNESVDIPTKKPRIDQDLTAIENSTTAVIALEKLPIEPMSNLKNSPELFKALNQPTLKRAAEKLTKEIEILAVPEGAQISSESKKIDMPPQKEIQDAAQISLQQIPEGLITMSEITSKTSSKLKLTPSEPEKNPAEAVEVADVPKITVTEEEAEKAMAKVIQEEVKGTVEVVSGDQLLIPESSKDPIRIQEHQNWIAPAIRKVSSEPATRSESISTLTVIDEETRMSAESGSRSQTPARNVPVPGTSETLVNEESQGSTATTESEKVKVKNRRMEINFDPDEGPFTVDKIAEYEWPLDRKDERPAGRGETFMIQEQISQYLGVKSFKRKYPDLKRRMVDMEERNYLRENGLVSESMCDMGLTAVSSSEVLDIMCSDFPEQYEEYRKHMREKVAREHSKKQKELSAAANAERTRIDLAEMAMQSALSWNAGLNKARQDSRKCSLDLQTFTVHVPKRPLKPNQTRRDNHYPVALVPGQYTDYYREYTPAELRYYPLNTVLYGPMRPNERKFDSQSEGSQSDSDSDSSSDDSSSSSSEGTQDTEGSQSTMDEVDMELALQSDIKCKMCLNNLNKSNRPEVLIQCGTCNGNVHPSCIDLTLDMVPHIRAYAWQCTDCKTCAQCHDPADEDKMLFCDMCDRGYHIYCVGLRRVPQGRWHCQECAVCANCGSKEPGGANSDRNSVAQWQHEYKKGDKNTRVYVSTFCVPCSKLRGNQGIDN